MFRWRSEMGVELRGCPLKSLRTKEDPLQLSEGQLCATREVSCARELSGPGCCRCLDSPEPRCFTPPYVSVHVCCSRSRMNPMGGGEVSGNHSPQWDGLVLSPGGLCLSLDARRVRKHWQAPGACERGGSHSSPEAHARLVFCIVCCTPCLPLELAPRSPRTRELAPGSPCPGGPAPGSLCTGELASWWASSLKYLPITPFQKSLASNILRMCGTHFSQEHHLFRLVRTLNSPPMSPPPVMTSAHGHLHRMYTHLHHPGFLKQTPLSADCTSPFGGLRYRRTCFCHTETSLVLPGSRPLPAGITTYRRCPLNKQRAPERARSSRPLWPL